MSDFSGSSPILRSLRLFSDWRFAVADSLHQFADLATEIGLLPGGSILRMENVSFNIKNNILRLAIVGEFSRGKSELINALFFANMGKRFLPTSSGQTTMCPVEIHGSSEGKKGLHLLPIFSRSMDVSIEKLKKADSAWTRLILEADDKERNKQLQVLAETICVTIEEARRIGLCPPLNRTNKEMGNTICPSCGLGKVLIPRWRHALLYIPHPILDAGLTVLDTPGLNAIGAEPELTFSMLSEAEAVIFLLGIDTGVTQSDLIIWEQYLKKNNKQKQLVLLNKIDTLWDELRDPFEVAEEIELQIERTATRLGIHREQIIPVSGQKGLLARIRGDAELLERSGILDLERAIADLLIPSRRKQLGEQARQAEEKVLLEQRILIEDQTQRIGDQIAKLVNLKDRGIIMIPKMIRQHQDRLSQFEEDRKKFDLRKQSFQEQVQELLLIPLSTETLDSIIVKAKNEMLSAWTTVGIVDRFRIFFTDVINQFNTSIAGMERINEEIAREYADLHGRYALPARETLPYVILPRKAELLEMAQSYERFGVMMEIAVNTQGAVVRKAFLTAAEKVRGYVLETRKDIQSWLDEMMTVLNQHLQSYEDREKEELLALEKISQTMSGIDARINVLRSQQESLAKQHLSLEMGAKRLQSILEQA